MARGRGLSEKFSQGLCCARECQLVPGNISRGEEPYFKTLVVAGERSSGHGCYINNDHGRDPGIGVDIEQAIDADLDARFFACLSHRCGHDLFTAIDKSAGAHPLPVSRLNRASDEDDVIVAARMIVATATLGSW